MNRKPQRRRANPDADDGTAPAPQPAPHPAAVEATLAAAIQRLRSGQRDRAEVIFRRVLEAQPSHPVALHLLGEIALQRGQYEAAADLIGKSVAHRPDYAEAHSSLGVAIMNQGNNEAAAASYQKAVALKPGFADAHVNLGVARANQGRLDEAVASFRKALALAPNAARTHYNLGKALKDQGKFADAVAAYRRAVALAPNAPRIHQNLGNALNLQGLHEEAIAALRKAIAIRPDYARAHTNLAAVLLQHGAARAALEVCDSYLEDHPGTTDVLAVKAFVLDELGQRDAVRFLVDFDRLIRPTQFKSAPGFDSLADLNAALKHHVYAHPTLEYEPRRYSTRFGKHSGDLLVEPKGPVAVLEEMIGGAVEDYMRALPADPAHPFLASPPRQWRLKAWAVAMESQGHQVPHNHPAAWLSGVYYVQVPGVVAMAGQGEAGWIEFGRPPADIHCTVEPEVRALQPKEGLMVLFPSYFYHRTVPFEAAEERISIAFDVLAEDRAVSAARTDGGVRHRAAANAAAAGGSGTPEAGAGAGDD